MVGPGRDIDTSARASRALAAIFLAGVAALALVGPSQAVAKRGMIKIRTVQIASPGNPSVGIVPFQDAIYSSCSTAPQSSPPCMTVGSVGYPYSIGEFEITVKQYVTFLNVADPTGRDPHDLWD